jgi:hypothetical protein
MKCISQVDGIEILREIHEGECGHHAAARSIASPDFSCRSLTFLDIIVIVPNTLDQLFIYIINMQ